LAKITDTDYFLPNVLALNRLESLVRGGTTEPMLIRGICTTTQEKDDYVVKFKRSPRMSIESSCRELIAAFIAMEIDLNTVQPALISVNQDFINTVKGHDGYKAASESIGFNFGTVYKCGYSVLIKNQILEDELMKYAEEIFAFDLLISNPDRRTEKPNLLCDGSNILIFDHEMAFSYTTSIFKNPTPWILDEYDYATYKNHYFYHYLRKNGFSFEAFSNKLKLLDQNFWRKLSVLIPEEWKNDQVELIMKTLNLIINNKDTFIKEIKKLLL